MQCFTICQASLTPADLHLPDAPPCSHGTGLGGPFARVNDSNNHNELASCVRTCSSSQLPDRTNAPSSALTLLSPSGNSFSRNTNLQRNSSSRCQGASGGGRGGFSGHKPSVVLPPAAGAPRPAVSCAVVEAHMAD